MVRGGAPSLLRTRIAGIFSVPTKESSCELVQHGIAGPAPDQILDAIRAEYWLPAGKPQPSNASQDTAQPAQADTSKTSPQVKP
jgi:hypothetical protein